MGNEDNSKTFFLISQKTKQKTYVVNPHKNCFNKMVLMLGHKTCFYGEIWLYIPNLSLLSLLIWSIENWLLLLIVQILSETSPSWGLGTAISMDVYCKQYGKIYCILKIKKICYLKKKNICCSIICILKLNKYGEILTSYCKYLAT